ncbi:hypothetical protein RchiOBHm_Chr5g0033131 [Rosa chinensis]|uniref:Uncharacterized protein n=1 Tax=Rosa chinensis TaxID=74649 RepID=A0A2P6QAK7_ROSCH|nr:hypothetical protein RchiOBHm_Chr5g0033131 [Rosa chinensis]
MGIDKSEESIPDKEVRPTFILNPSCVSKRRNSFTRNHSNSFMC